MNALTEINEHADTVIRFEILRNLPFIRKDIVKMILKIPFPLFIVMKKYFWSCKKIVYLCFTIIKYITI